MAKLGVYFLACGLTGLAVGAGLSGFVIIGLLGMALALGAIILLLVGGVLVGGIAVPRGRAIAGLTLFVIGTGLLCWATGEACMAASDGVRYVQVSEGPQPTTIRNLIEAVGGALFAASLLGWGLRFRTGWSTRRALTWACAAFTVCPVAVVIFLALSRVLPLDA